MGDPCPVCMEPLDLVNLGAHFAASHTGSFRRDHWACGACSFKADDIWAVSTHCLRRGHDSSRMIFCDEEESAVREAIAQLQAALRPQEPVPEAQYQNVRPAPSEQIVLPPCPDDITEMNDIGNTSIIPGSIWSVENPDASLDLSSIHDESTLPPTDSELGDAHGSVDDSDSPMDQSSSVSVTVNAPAKPVKTGRLNRKKAVKTEKLDASFKIKPEIFNHRYDRSLYLDEPLIFGELLGGLGEEAALALSARCEDPPLFSTRLLSPLQIARLLDTRLTNAYRDIDPGKIGDITPTFLALREIKEAVYLLRGTEKLLRDAVRQNYTRDRLGRENFKKAETHSLLVGRRDGAADPVTTRRLRRSLHAYQLPPDACVLRSRCRVYKSDRIKRELWTLESEGFQSPFMVMQASWLRDHEPEPWDLETEAPDSTTDIAEAPAHGEASKKELNELVTWMRSETSKYNKMEPWKAFRSQYDAQDFLQPRFCRKSGPPVIGDTWKATKYHCRFKYVPRGLSLEPCRVTVTFLVLPQASLLLTNTARHSHSQPWTHTQYSAPKSDPQ